MDGLPDGYMWDGQRLYKVFSDESAAPEKLLAFVARAGGHWHAAKLRSDAPCMNCGTVIPKGTWAARNKRSAAVCLDCLDAVMV